MCILNFFVFFFFFSFTMENLKIRKSDILEFQTNLNTQTVSIQFIRTKRIIIINTLIENRACVYVRVTIVVAQDLP